MIETLTHVDLSRPDELQLIKISQELLISSVRSFFCGKQISCHMTNEENMFLIWKLNYQLLPQEYTLQSLILIGICLIQPTTLGNEIFSSIF
mgnify:CR=1 FL=1